MLGNSIIAPIAVRSLAHSTGTATSPFALIRQYHAASLPWAPTLHKPIPIPNSLSSPFSTNTSVRCLGTGALNPRSYDVWATAASSFILPRQYHAASLPSALTPPKFIPIPNRLSSPFSTASVPGLESGPLNAGTHGIPSAPINWELYRLFQSGACNNKSHEVFAPINRGLFCVVPEKKAFMIERLGDYLKTLHSGIHFLIPLVDRIAYVYSLEEEAVPIRGLFVWTRDNVDVLMEGVLYVEQNKILEETERRTLEEKIVTKMHVIAEDCGVKCRIEIQDIYLPHEMRAAAMRTVAEAEQIKRVANEIAEMVAEAARKKKEKESSSCDMAEARRAAAEAICKLLLSIKLSAT